MLAYKGFMYAFEVTFY